MSLRTVILAAALAAIAITAASAVFVPKASDAVLLNPHMGLYLQHPPTDAKPDEWFMKTSGIAYYRFDWSEVNPAEGVLRFDAAFKPLFDFWVGKNGKRVAFRMMSQNPHSGTCFVTPRWVYGRGVPEVRHKGIYLKEQSDPVFWNDRYLEIQREFIKKLGAYLDGREGLEFVDIGGIGCWGEMHLGFWTTEELEKAGYTEGKWAAAYRAIIDAYKAAFPRTPVFLNVGGREHLMINDYAAINGMHFRQDGLKPDGASYNVEEWLFPEYARRGVMGNFEFHSGLNEMREKNWDLKTTINKGLSAPISYMNTNLFSGSGYRGAPREAIDLLTDAARRIGYRFSPTRIEHSPEAGVSPNRPTRVLIRSEWKNMGIAPSHDSFAVVWSLIDPAGKTAASDTAFPVNPTNRWWPGETQTIAGTIRLPAGSPPGIYRLAVAMVLPETGRPIGSIETIGLGIEGRDNNGRYLLDSIRIKPEKSANNTVFETGFETVKPAWDVPKGMTAGMESDEARTGKGSLVIAGSLKDGWNYAWHNLPSPLIGGARYRLTGWMLVEKMDPSSLPPYLKLGVNGRKGVWLTNINTEKYDPAMPGTWQKLTAVGDLPPDAEIGEISVEKGDNTTAASVKLRLDDITLEITEGI